MHFHLIHSTISLDDFICKSKLNGLVCVHPCFRIHEVCQLCSGHSGFQLISIDDGILHAFQHVNGSLHFPGIPKCNGHRIVDHHRGYRRHQHPVTGHGNDRSCGCRNAVNLDCDLALILTEHVINLGSRHTVSTGRIDPDCNVSTSIHQFFLEHLRCDVIIKPAILCDGAV